ncbi:MAG TPA: cadherin-like domain-containing protein [Acidimicrobiales bacterium]|nr:cadherin-like domain-containing protein [Acidimicrobiales bacterium]
MRRRFLGRSLPLLGSVALVSTLLGTAAIGALSAPASADGSQITVQNQTYSVLEDGFLNIAAPGVLAGASDSNTGVGPLTAVGTSGPTANGSVTFDSNGDGGFQYTPNAGFYGTDTFTYAASDGTYQSADATVTINVIDPVATKTAIISENPPASDPSTPVTFIAQVTPGGAGPPLSGSVTFTYTCPGSACSSSSGTLGTVPIDPSTDQATLTSTGQLPVGADYVTATYGSDPNYSGSSGSVVYTVDASCNNAAWPASTNGYPATEASGPTGFYIGQSNGWWTVYTEQDANRGPGTFFSGKITTTTARFLDVAALKNETNDYVKEIGNNEIEFRFQTELSLDAVTFFVGCGNDVKFTLWTAPATSKHPVNVKAPVSEINIGNPTTNPASNPFTYNR